MHVAQMRTQVQKANDIHTSNVHKFVWTSSIPTRPTVKTNKSEFCVHQWTKIRKRVLRVFLFPSPPSLPAIFHWFPHSPFPSIFYACHAGYVNSSFPDIASYTVCDSHILTYSGKSCSEQFSSI